MIFFPLNFLHSILYFFRINSTKSNVDDSFTSVQISSSHQTLHRVLCLGQSLNGRAYFPPPSVIFLQDSIAWKGFFSNLPAILLRRCVPMSISFPMGSSFYCRKFSFKFISADIFRISIPFPSYFRYQAVRPAYGNGRPPHMGTTGLPAGN